MNLNYRKQSETLSEVRTVSDFFTYLKNVEDSVRLEEQLGKCYFHLSTVSKIVRVCLLCCIVNVREEILKKISMVFQSLRIKDFVSYDLFLRHFP